MDVAASVNGGYCFASSSYFENPTVNWRCTDAIDQNSVTEWATNGEGVGAWIQFNWQYTVEICAISVSPRRNGEFFRDFRLELYKNGSTQWVCVDLSLSLC